MANLPKPKDIKVKNLQEIMRTEKIQGITKVNRDNRVFYERVIQNKLAEKEARIKTSNQLRENLNSHFLSLEKEINTFIASLLKYDTYSKSELENERIMYFVNNFNKSTKTAIENEKAIENTRIYDNGGIVELTTELERSARKLHRNLTQYHLDNEKFQVFLHNLKTHQEKMSIMVLALNKKLKV